MKVGSYIYTNSYAPADTNQLWVKPMSNGEAILYIFVDGKWAPTGGVGESAYEAAVKAGFNGSKEEWLDSLALKYSDLTAEQKADLVKDAVSAAERAAQAVENIENAINDIDVSSTDGAITVLVAKQGALENKVDVLGPKLVQVENKTKPISKEKASSNDEVLELTGDNDSYIAHLDSSGTHSKDFFIQESKSSTPKSVSQELDSLASEIERVESEMVSTENIEKEQASSKHPEITLYDEVEDETIFSLKRDSLYATSFVDKYGKIDSRFFERYNPCDIVLDKPVLGQSKTAVFFGDSITRGVGATDNSHRYSSVLCNMAGFVETNKGISGAVLDPDIAVSESLGDITDSIKTTTISNYDYVFIAGGTNDIAKGITYDKLYAVMMSLCAWIDANKGDAKIYIITPINKVIAKGANCSMDDARRAELEAAIQYGFNILDGGGIPFPSYSSNWSRLVFADGLHPSDIGHSIFAKTIYSKLI